MGRGTRVTLLLAALLLAAVPAWAHPQERRHQDRGALRGTQLAAPVAALERSSLGREMRESKWLYPAVEIVHLIGIALLFGSIAILDLRLLGFSRSISVRALAGHVLPWAAASFLLIVPSGLMMFVAYAGELISSKVFAYKMCLILGAGGNAALFHSITFPSVGVWDSEEMRKLPPPLSARIAGAASLLIWMSVIACGRLLAYF